MSRRFNPLTNESDMFKVLVGVVAACVILAVLVVIGRALF